MQEVKREIEDRFGKLPNNLLIYMYEEWFEKLAQKLNIVKVLQTDKIIEIELPEDISNKVKGDKLFLTAYNICPKFQFKYFLKKIHISLPILNLDKHFLEYLIKLLEELIDELAI